MKSKYFLQFLGLMKKTTYLLSIPAILLLVWGFTQFSGWGKNKQTIVPKLNFTFSLKDTSLIKPKDIHPKKAILLSGLMRSHYAKKNIDKDISMATFDAYLKSLDGGKSYFLEADIEKFKIYREKFAFLIEEGQVDVPFQIFNIYKQRFTERMDFVDKLLEKEPDFNADEYLETDREKLAWFKTQKDMEDEWRKRIKNEMLGLKLAGKKFDEIKTTLKKRYERSRKTIYQINSEDVFQYAMNAFTESFDPHTNYFSPVNAQNFNMNMKKSFEGIGARLRSQEDYTIINEVMPGGPAFKSKELKKDDKIIAIAQGEKGDFEDVVGWRIDDVIGLIRGTKGTVVRLKITPANSAAGAPPKIVRLVRDKIKIEDESATKKIINTKRDGKDYKIGVITIPSFYIDFNEYVKGNKDYKSTSGDVKKLIGELKSENIDGLVIDLRNNGGGSLKEAIDLTGLFIKTGPVVQIKDASGDIDVQPDKNPDVTYQGELAVMVNTFSASASEIFAGAIQDYKRGVIIGEQTFGKGTVQSPMGLAEYMRSEDQNQGQINLTISKFYRITGSSTQNRGVMPDVNFPAMFDRTEVGESSERSALPWDEIKPSRFTPTDDINSKNIDRLKKVLDAELKSDKDLKELVSEIEDAKKMRKRTKISLNFAKRKTETEEFEKKYKKKTQTDEEETAPNTTEKEKKDAYLEAGAKLLAELISLKK
ncbi:MAG: tail-specific protease [Bacteroidetes bacterium]|nr:MAG: tail-specific protease [Bacteroidota bacterium]TAG89003.1 MAG: tail-specific protease [Bacteroidota bacterium]